MRVKCKQCDGYYVLRNGKFGAFGGCSNFPRCRSTIRLEEYRRLESLTEDSAAGAAVEPAQVQASGEPLPSRYVAFDVETPNACNDRISAIGVAVVENGTIVDELNTLVNPETRFDRFNVQLTGITPEMAAEAPTFPELWPTLGPLLDSGLLIAHNATFDMTVLAKCLRDYGIAWRSSAAYACTVRMGRSCCPELPNHKLNTMCTYLQIPLHHHQAGSDSRACAQLLLHYLDRGLDIRRFRRTYDLIHCRTVSS